MIMSEKELQKMRKLDEASEQSGGFVAPFTKQDTHYNYQGVK